MVEERTAGDVIAPEVSHCSIRTCQTEKGTGERSAKKKVQAFPALNNRPSKPRTNYAQPTTRVWKFQPLHVICAILTVLSSGYSSTRIRRSIDHQSLSSTMVGVLSESETAAATQGRF